MRIEICGGIASGKTTLCQILEANGVFASYEDFQSNPFYKSFYKNPQHYAFETELSFLLQHYSTIKTCAKTKFVATDFSLVQDMAYADVTLFGERHALFTSLHDILRKEIGLPDLLIHIQCHENILLNRIRLRDRDAEQNIPAEYLLQVNTALERQVHMYSQLGIGKLFVIDSEQVDFRNSLAQVSDLKSYIWK